MKIAKLFLAIGIAVIFAVFIGYGLYAIYEPPQNRYESSDCFRNFKCEEMGNCELKPVLQGTTPFPTPQISSELCRENLQRDPAYKQCQIDREKCDRNYFSGTERYKYLRNVFWILISVGFISVIGGIFLSFMEGIGSGFIGGGILIIIYSLIYTARYWISFNKFFKVGALAVILIALIWFGYKKLEKATWKKDDEK